MPARRTAVPACRRCSCTSSPTPCSWSARSASWRSWRARGDDRTDLDSFRGLGKRQPALALALTVFLVAQAGVPFTSGFIAKFGVISAAVDEESYALAIIAMLASVIAAFLYLRIMVSAWILEPPTTTAPSR